MIENKNPNNSNERVISDLIAKRNVIVPMIGEGAVEVLKDSESEPMGLQEFLVNKFQETYPDIEVPENVNRTMREPGYYGLSLLLQKYNERYEDDIMEFVKNNKKHIRLKKEVKDFLKTFDFPIILTTLCFDFIENELDEYKSIWYQPCMANKATLVNQKCVYHLFGQADYGKDWVYDEETLLQFLLSHYDERWKASSLKDYLQDNKKNLFVLGCNPPNWLFRFLWATTFLGPSKKLNTTRGYWVNQCRPIDSFENFLKCNRITSSEQVMEILRSATERLKEELSEMVQENDTDEHFDVFLSYASEDRHIATEVYQKLRDLNVKVWFDDRGAGAITPGDKYWINIQKGIQSSTYFMPLITENWMKKQFDFSSALKKETNMASDWLLNPSNKRTEGKYSIPVIVDGTMYNGREITPQKIEVLGDAGMIPTNLFYDADGIEILVYRNDINVFEKIRW